MSRCAIGPSLTNWNQLLIEELASENVVYPKIVYQIAQGLIESNVGQIQEIFFLHRDVTVEKAHEATLASQDSLTEFKKYFIEDRLSAALQIAIKKQL